MKLLIVEDNESMRRLLRGIVQDLAEAIYECSDGSQAFSAYAACRPDWVLMDIRLPGLDGIAATKRIIEVWPEARILIVTEFDDEKLRAAADRAGARDYLLKEDLTSICRLLAEAYGT